MISVLLTLILLSTYLNFKERAKKKYGGSIVFQIIDREYSNWFKRDRNGMVINKKTASMFEVDKVIFNLKENFENQGVSKDQLKEYLDFLSNNEPKKIGIYSILLAILGYLGSNTFLKSLLPDLNNITDVSKVFNKIADTFNKNRDIVLLSLYLFFFIAIVVLLSYISYKAATADNVYINTQKIYVLKRAEKIWDFQKEITVSTEEDARNELKDSKNKIFSNLVPSKSKFSEEFDRAIGDTFKKNYEYFKGLPFVNSIKWQGIKEWILGMLLPIGFQTIIFILTYLMIAYGNKLPIVLLFALFVLILYTIYMFMLITMTQIDKQNIKVSLGCPIPMLQSKGPTSGHSTSVSESVILADSEAGNSKEVKKILNREIKNRRVFFSYIILLVNYCLCLIILCLNSTDHIRNIKSIICDSMVILSILITFITIMVATFMHVEDNSKNFIDGSFK